MGKDDPFDEYMYMHSMLSNNAESHDSEESKESEFNDNYERSLVAPPKASFHTIPRPLQLSTQ